MKVCGFCFIRNAVKFDYPVVEAIASILPACNKFIVAVGDCDDGTRALIESIDSKKIEIIDTVWNLSLRERSKILTSETNKAFDAIPAEYDWCFYIHGDEVVHEKFLPGIMLSMKKYLDVKEIDGLIMNYTHFYGTFDYYGDSRRWSKSEIRIVRNNKGIRSWYNAQGFHWENGKKLTGVFIDGGMNHYEWVRSPKLMKDKIEESKSIRIRNSKHIKTTEHESEEFAYEKDIDSLKQFREYHPKVMQARIKAINWYPNLSTKKKKFSIRHFLLYYLENFLGFRPFEKKHFNVFKES
ncbi:MAG: glycosyltransferase family 2 protein [Bacteroidia bacterium]|nr:glycosyltransferase family 2 protein [Bacteroidia bacterium]